MYYYKFKFIYNEGFTGAKLYEEFSHFKNDIDARRRYKDLFKEIPDRIISSHWRDAEDHEGYKINVEALFKGYNTHFKTGKIHYCHYRDYKLAYCTNRKFQHVNIIDNSNIVNCKNCWDKIKHSTFHYKVIWQHDEKFYNGIIGINAKDYDIRVKLFHENMIDKKNIKTYIDNSKNYINLKKFIEKKMKTKLEKDYKIWLFEKDF